MIGNIWGGGCSRAANKCKEGEVVSWPVTTPLWADPDINTPFVDKFGITRHSPKGSCYASMPEVPSGKILSPKPTIAEMTKQKGLILKQCISSALFR